jgi:hypothetical protein
MKRRKPTSAVWILFLASSGAVLASPPPPAAPAPPISGIVSHMERPIADALVVFYNLDQATLTRSHTAPDGTFVVVSAPVGVYDLIAVKKGYRPALQRVWHQSDPRRVSAVHIELAALTPEARGKPASESLWELRDRLPVDVLREIVLDQEAPPAAAGNRLRLGRSMAAEVRAVGDMGTNEGSLARTAVGVQGGLPNGWQYNLRGDYAAVSGAASADNNLLTTGNAEGLALDVATSPLDRLSLQTRRHTLSFHDEGPASLQTHGISWSRGAEEGTVESVAARYVEETNLYKATSAGTSFSPVASRTWEVRANYARPAGDALGVSVAMTYRHREGTIGPSGVGVDGTFFVSAPDADLSAAASTKLSSRAQVEGGVVARYVSGGYGIAPMATVRYDLGDRTAVFVKGLFRAQESGTDNGTTMPLVVSIDERGDATARKGFEVGLERRAGDDGSYLVEFSSQRVGEAVRAFFEGDFLTDFDSVYFFDGNLIRQYRASATHRLSDRVSGTVNAMYGTIGSDVAPLSAAAYGITSNRGHYWTARAGIQVLPTRTGVALILHGSRQTLAALAAPHTNDSEKVAVSVSQDLSVMGVSPFGSVCKLLVALESARSTAEREDSPTTKRVLGGVAISF